MLTDPVSSPDVAVAKPRLMISEIAIGSREQGIVSVAEAGGTISNAVCPGRTTVVRDKRINDLRFYPAPSSSNNPC